MNTNETVKRLPALLIFADGTPVRSPDDWHRRRFELLEMVLSIEYGQPPAKPERVEVYALHTFRTQGGVDATHYRLTMHPTGFQFTITAYKPSGVGPFPAIIDGDGCWDNITTDIINDVIGRGTMLVVFSRAEIVPDNFSSARDTGLYVAMPEDGYGALSAWAWGYHRVVDALLTFDDVDAARIIVTGHSRGGKAALLAGATDERISLTAPNNSGCGGAGCFHFPDDGGETIGDIGRNFPYWFSPNLIDYAARDRDLPFDQHAVKALLAPRGLLTTEALGDAWASPRGSFITHSAAREVYDLLGQSKGIGIRYREGGHAHTLEDWRTLLDFADATLSGKPATRDYQANPWDLQ